MLTIGVWVQSSLLCCSVWSLLFEAHEWSYSLGYRGGWFIFDLSIGCLCMKWSIPHVVFSLSLTDFLEPPHQQSLPLGINRYTSNLTFLQRLFLLAHPIPYNLFGLYYWYKAVDPDCNHSYMETCSPVIFATAIGLDFSCPFVSNATFFLTNHFQN